MSSVFLILSLSFSDSENSKRKSTVESNLFSRESFPAFHRQVFQTYMKGCLKIIRKFLLFLSNIN